MEPLGSLRRLGWMFARLVAVAVVFLNAWIFANNFAETNYRGWILVWILVSGLVGTMGGLVYLISVDGPMRHRSRRWRALGWWAMLASVMLPHSLQMLAIPSVLALFPTLNAADASNGVRFTSS